jgi:hypothetical protein
MPAARTWQLSCDNVSGGRKRASGSFQNKNFA